MAVKKVTKAKTKAKVKTATTKKKVVAKRPAPRTVTKPKSQEANTDRVKAKEVKVEKGNLVIAKHKIQTAEGWKRTRVKE